MKLLAIPLILAATYTFPSCSKAEGVQPVTYKSTTHYTEEKKVAVQLGYRVRF